MALSQRVSLKMRKRKKVTRQPNLQANVNHLCLLSLQKLCLLVHEHYMTTQLAVIKN